MEVRKKESMRYLIRASILLIPTLVLVGNVCCFAQQCVTDVQQLLPTADRALYTEYGSEVAISGDYLVVSEPSDNTIEVQSGAAHIYKADASGQWQKLAKLVPSSAHPFTFFGEHVVIHDNTIVVSGHYYDNLGQNLAKLFVFEKDPLAEWISGSELYQISLPVAAGIQDLDFDGTDLAVSFLDASGPGIQIYRKSPGTFALVKQWSFPVSVFGFSAYGQDISVNNGILAVAAPQAETATKQSGRVLIYEYTGAAWPESPNATFMPAPSEVPFGSSRLGIHVLVHDNTVFIIGSTSTIKLYLQTRPPTGWQDAVLSPTLALQSTMFSMSMDANDDYLSISFEYSSVDVYHRGSDWNTLSLVNQLDNPVEAELRFGKSVALGPRHVVVGAPAMSMSSIGQSKTLSYHSPVGDWSSLSSPNEVLEEGATDATHDLFGQSTAINEKFVVVGASGDMDRGFSAGAAYVYFNNGVDLVKTEKLVAPDGKAGDAFGHAIAMSDSVLFVGAISADSIASNGNILLYDMGKVYVYRLTASGWVLHSQLTAPTKTQHAKFGQMIACRPGIVAISEYATNSSSSVGWVHLYEVDNNQQWHHIATLSPFDRIQGDSFGRSISMNDSTIVIGTGNPEFMANTAMKVYVYERHGTWKSATEDAQLLPTDKARLDYFGYSVGLYGNHIVVGAPGAPGLPDAIWSSDLYLRGAAYVFEKPPGGWSGTISEKAKLVPSDPARYRMFGFSVAIDNNDIFIGSPYGYLVNSQVDQLPTHEDLSKIGKVYHFIADNHNWQSSDQEIRQFFSTSPEGTDLYGYSLTVGFRTLLSGCIYDDNEVGFRAGSVFAIGLDPIIESLTRPRCVEDGPVQLTAIPSGGVWSGAGFSDATSGIFNPADLDPGTYPVTYTITGCQAFNEVVVISSQLLVGETSPANQTRCSYNNAILLVESNADPAWYTWYFRENPTDAFTVIAAGVKQITTDIDGYYRMKIGHPICFSHVEEFVLNSEHIEVTPDDPPVACDDNPVVLAATPAGGQWTGTGVSSNGVFNPQSQPDGTYNLTYIINTTLGCQFSDSVIMLQNKILASTITASKESICEGEAVSLSVSPLKSSTTVTWFREENPSLALSSSMKYTVVEPGNYFAALNHLGCIGTTASIAVTAKLDSVFVPNVFTPNSDLYNDTFHISGGDLKGFSVQVIDRSGMLHFESNDSGFQWLGQDSPSGVYYYRISFLGCSDVRKEYRGWVQLIR